MKNRLVNKYTFVDWRKTKKTPQPTEALVSGGYVKWGKNNDYPMFLNTLIEKSPTHSGIIIGKSYYISGAGIDIQYRDENILKSILENGIDNDSFEEVVKDCVLDYEKYNGFCFRGVWDLLTGNLKYISHIDFDNVRTNADKTLFFYTEDWTKENEFKIYHNFDPSNRVGEFLFYHSETKKKTDKNKLGNIYPSPVYASCIESIMTEIEIKSYHLHGIMNEFKTGTIIYLPTRPGDDRERLELVNEIKMGATDREAANSVAVLFGEGGTERPEILTLNGNDLDKRYMQTEVHVVESIMRGHVVNSPSLFGLRTQGKLGDTQEMEIGFSIFKNVYVKSRQDKINKLFNWFLKKIYGENISFKLNEVDFIIPKKEDVNEVEKNNFSAKDPVLKAFERVGLKRNNFVFSKSMPVPDDADEQWFNKSESEIFENLKKENIFFSIALTETQKNILKLIKDGNDAPSIARALQIKVSDVIAEYTYLSEKKLINVDGSVAANAIKYLESSPASIDEFEIRYSYELRPDAPKLKGESRPFCKALVSLDKLYTRKEIDAISSSLGNETNQFDAWRYRGGWYSNPQTKTNTPFCRHIWMQNVVARKK
jgi:hypothetical protein